MSLAEGGAERATAPAAVAEPPVAAQREPAAGAASSSSSSDSTRCAAGDTTPVRVVFCDIDGTLAHYASEFAQYASIVEENAGVAKLRYFSTGREVTCLVLPASLSGSKGYISARSYELIEELRLRHGVAFALISGSRSSTFLQRRRCLPRVDFEIIENGGRIWRRRRRRRRQRGWRDQQRHCESDGSADPDGGRHDGGEQRAHDSMRTGDGRGAEGEGADANDDDSGGGDNSDEMDEDLQWAERLAPVTGFHGAEQLRAQQRRHQSFSPPSSAALSSSSPPSPPPSPPSRDSHSSLKRTSQHWQRAANRSRPHRPASTVARGSRDPVDDGVYRVRIPDRAGALWRACEQLMDDGWAIDARDYHTSFRVAVPAADADKFGADVVRRQLAPRGLRSAYNLGKADVFPAASGKCNAAAHVLGELGVNARRAVAMFDDDNDVELGEMCARAYLPSVTHESVRDAVRRNSDRWSVTSARGPLGTEEALERVLALVSGGAVASRAAAAT